MIVRTRAVIRGGVIVRIMLIVVEMIVTMMSVPVMIMIKLKKVRVGRVNMRPLIQSRRKFAMPRLVKPDERVGKNDNGGNRAHEPDVINEPPPVSRYSLASAPRAGAGLPPPVRLSIHP